MPSATINSSAQGSILTGTASTGIHFVWKDCVLAPNGIVQTSSVANQQDIGPWVVAARSGNNFRLGRTFCYFDTSAYAGTITALSLDFGSSGTSGINDYIVCESYAFNNGNSGTLSPGEFDRNSGWDVNTALSGQQSFVGGLNTVTLNGSAVALANGGLLNLVLIDYTYDYPDSAPGVGTHYGTINVGTSFQLDITYTTASGFDSINGTTYTGLSQVNSVNRTGFGIIDEINSIQA